MKTKIRKIFLRFFGARAFSKYIVKIGESETYGEFCTQVYGENLCQLNMMDMEQLKMLLDSVNIKPGDAVLDLGCGAGRITEYIAKKYPAKTIGIDSAAGPIKQASERTKGLKENLSFQVSNINNLKFSDQSFDVILCIDTLYFVNDLNQVISKLKSLLRPGGRIAAFFTMQLKEGQNSESLSPEKNELGLALTKNNLSYKTWDYTENDRQIWLKTIDVANALKERFEQEKNPWIYKTRIAEAEKCLKPHQNKTASRYLYLIDQN
jgi:ubiquinone/menaquinone biosynthesis C-methylase UbiE